MKHGAPRALRDTIEEELTALGNTRSGGLKGLLADLASGRVLSDPFPAGGTDRIRGRLSEVLSKELERWTPTGKVQDQPFKVRLLGNFLRDAGDLVREFLKMAECGVRISIRMALPRTPAVYPEKLSRRLREQRDLDLTSTIGDVEGKWRDIYSSAVNFANEVEEALEDLVLIRELREALGRMVFVYGALTYDRPVLAPPLRLHVSLTPGGEH